MSKHDKTHVEEGFFNVHNRQLHELCDCLRDTHIFQKSEIALAIVSALMCNSVLHSPARAEDLLLDFFEINVEKFSNFRWFFSKPLAS